MNRKVFFYLFYTVAVLLFIEVILRFCFPLPELSNFNRITYQIQAHQKVNQPYLRNIEMIWRSYPDTVYDFVHDLNRYGFRDSKEWKVEKRKGKKRVLFLGDSFVEGMMSTQGQTIPEGFMKAAGSMSKQLEYFNAGMMGVGMNEYMKFVRDAVPIFKPDELILVLYSNDAPFQRKYQAGRKIRPKEHTFWRPRLLTLIESIEAGAPIPFRFAPEQRPFYKAVPDPSNPWTYKADEIKPHVMGKVAEAMQEGNFNFFRYNWILEEEKFLKASIQMKGKLDYINFVCKQNQCRLTVFYVPSRSQVSGYYYQFDRALCLQKCPDYLDLTGEQYQKHARQIAKDCESLRIPFFDLTDEVKAKEKQGNHLYWNYDDHMRGKGYLFLGREIYKRWQEN